MTIGADLTDGKFLRNVIIKAVVLLIAANLLFAAVFPMKGLAGISVYNRVFRGRERFPFGENPAKAYNLSLYSLEAMFSAHEVTAKPDPNEFRVFVIGDSSIWGTLLTPDQTLTGQLNAANLKTCEGKPIRFYNLGYPTLSLVKDVMVMDEAKKYQPDQIIWLFTEEAFPRDKQLSSPIAANNPERIRSLIDRYGIALEPSNLQRPSFWDQTIVGQRRELADLLRLQLYGVMWSATGIDQEYPDDYPPAQRDFDKMDLLYHGKTEQEFSIDDLSMDVLKAGVKSAGEIPVTLINEPMMVSTGKMSDQRYNFFYPRWAYDLYREWMDDTAKAQGWNYIDAWNLAGENEYTNSAIHLTPAGEQILAMKVITDARLPICKP